MVGAPPAALIGRGVDDAYPDPKDYEAILETMRRDGVVRDRDHRFRHADGHEFWVSCSVLSVTFEGQPAHLSAILNITECKRAEQELAFMVQFPELNQASLLRVDRDGSILLANAAARAVSRRAPGGAIVVRAMPGR